MQGSGATLDEQVAHHLMRFVEAFDAHRKAVSPADKTSSRNAKEECGRALARAYREREKHKNAKEN
jgi:hypothetical protein